jgi:hypothetical protein
VPGQLIADSIVLPRVRDTLAGAKLVGPKCVRREWGCSSTVAWQSNARPVRVHGQSRDDSGGIGSDNSLSVGFQRAA